MKYGDKNYKDKDPNRELEPDEILLLVAKYQQTGGDIRKAARAVNLTEEMALEIIDRESEKNRRILTDPTVLKIAGMTLRQIALDCMNNMLDKTGELYGKVAAQTAIYAMNQSIKLVNEWERQIGAKETSGKKVEEIDEQTRELDAEIERLERATTQRTQAEAEKTKAGAKPEAPVGVDAE